MQSAETVLGVLRERGRRGLPCEELYRQLFNRQLYLLAYGRIYANQGAMTPGATEETADGMSEERIDAIIDAMRHERYRFAPARRIYIPKRNGKLRPLGLPTWSDKLVGEVVRLLLEAYYEPCFSDRSHGFRPGRGCHTALREVANTWAGTTWFIEADISDCFGSFDHDIMIAILSEKIHDGRFLRLMRHMLEAGYLEDWTWNATLSGVPQGGVVSPVLSNIYLHKVDEYVETVLIPQHTRGRGRKRNPAYDAVKAHAAQARQRGDRSSYRELRRRMRSMSSRDPRDPGYRRLRYVRYADDQLLGFAGPKAEAERIKDQLATFLREDLGLELSSEKTLITHARTRAARFLGYEIIVQQADSRITHGPPVGQRDDRAARAARCDQGQMRPLPAARQTRASQCPAEPRRLPHRRHLRGRIPGHRPVLPACHRRLATRTTALDRRDVDAENACRQAPIQRVEDGSPVPGHHRHTVWTTRVLRGSRPTRRQAAAGRTVRWDTPRSESGRGHPRPGTPPA